MPAVAVDDILTLPAVAGPPATAQPRAVTSITDAPTGYEGEGFPVRRAFAGVPLHLLDPFIHMDQMGEVDYAPGEPRGTSWHPHRGFETVTYMIDGTFQHRDSIGGGGLISNGDTQWMTAGAGILHIERPPEQMVRSGGVFHGVQLWVNLPARDKRIAPKYQDLAGTDAGLGRSDDGGALVRVIAGDVGGISGPGSTHTPINYAHVTLAPGARIEIPWPANYNALVYALSGRGTVGRERRPFRSGQLAVLSSGDTIAVDAAQQQDSHTPALEILLLGGQPLGEPVAAHGPFVMNTRAELIEAIEDFQTGRMGTIHARLLTARTRADANLQRSRRGRASTATRHARRAGPHDVRGRRPRAARTRAAVVGVGPEGAPTASPQRRLSSLVRP